MITIINTPQYQIKTGTRVLCFRNNIESARMQPLDIPLQHAVFDVEFLTLLGSPDHITTENTAFWRASFMRASKFTSASQTSPREYRIVPLAGPYSSEFVSSTINGESGCLEFQLDGTNLAPGSVLYNDETDSYRLYNPELLPNTTPIPNLGDRYDAEHFAKFRYSCIGVVDIDLLSGPPDRIDSEEIFQKFFPNYNHWLSDLILSPGQVFYTPLTHLALAKLTSASCRRDHYWFKREMIRTFAPATFQKFRALPKFIGEDYFHKPELFPYISHGDANKIAYTPEDSKYRDRDRQIVLKPGRFLSKQCDLNDDEIRIAVSKLNGETPWTVEIATSALEFEHVYLNGPSSCMTHHIGWYDDSAYSGRLPITVLANGDIQIAYLQIPNGPIAARALIVESTKSWVEIYANNDAMEDAGSILKTHLRSLDYSHCPDALEGQTIEKLESNGQIVCPYIDCGGLNVTVYDSYLEIDSDGDRTPNYYTGCLSPNITCDHCEATTDEDDLTHVENGDRVCEECRRDHYVYAYESSRSNQRDWHPTDDCIYCENDSSYYVDQSDVLDYHDISRCQHSDEYHEGLNQCIVSDWHYCDQYLVYIPKYDGHAYEDHCVGDHEGVAQLARDCVEIDGQFYDKDSDLICNKKGEWYLLDTETPLSIDQNNLVHAA